MLAEQLNSDVNFLGTGTSVQLLSDTVHQTYRNKCLLLTCLQVCDHSRVVK